MKYSITIYLESKEDVIRKIEVDSKISLLEFHQFIKESFKLQNDELASFYITNNELELLKEIPLVTFEEDLDNINMENTNLESILNTKTNRLIYIYDYMLMWRFLIELTNDQGQTNKATCIKSIGEMPKDAPELNFSQDKNTESYEESLEDEYNQYDEF
jgi:hypothetical protein|tara:strand:+ start:3333 stop:3809 length:477 start_codon:yes stop_codon:yes gene_type:complete